MSEIKTNKISSLASNNNITIDPDGTGKVAFVSDITMTSDDPTITMTDSSGTNDIATIQATSGALIVTARDGSADGEIIFKKTDGSATDETMRINSSGHVGIGTSTLTGSGTPDETDNATGIRLLSSGFIGIGRDGGICGQFNRNNAGAILGFRRAGGEVGTISVSNTATAYNTSSDYRLKENVTATWDATTRLKQLNPVRFNFIADADTTVDGFLAHEAQTVVPEAVTGTHNGVETWTQQQIDDGDAPDGTSAGDNKLDDDGNTIPVMQGIDQSKLVPLLVKTIQELEARITALEAE